MSAVGKLAGQIIRFDQPWSFTQEGEREVIIRGDYLVETVQKHNNQAELMYHLDHDDRLYTATIPTDDLESMLFKKQLQVVTDECNDTVLKAESLRQRSLVQGGDCILVGNNANIIWPAIPGNRANHTLAPGYYFAQSVDSDKVNPIVKLYYEDSDLFVKIPLKALTGRVQKVRIEDIPDSTNAAIVAIKKRALEYRTQEEERAKIESELGPFIYLQKQGKQHGYYAKVLGGSGKHVLLGLSEAKDNHNSRMAEREVVLFKDLEGSTLRKNLTMDDIRDERRYGYVKACINTQENYKATLVQCYSQKIHSDCLAEMRALKNTLRDDFLALHGEPTREPVATESGRETKENKSDDPTLV